jgi:DNA-binding response OmpR family regulator
VVSIAIMGTVRVARPGQCAVDLTGQNAALLTRLVLAERMSLSASRLLQLVDGEEALEQAISRLRKQGIPIPARRRHDPVYRVETTRVDVDAERFQREMEELDGQPDLLPKRIDRLLRMWDADPRQLRGLRPEIWGPLFRARDRLIERVEGLSAERREQVTGLIGFVDVFEDDERVAGLRALVRPTPRQRLLIVEDRIAGTLVDILAGYDCAVVRSMAEWNAFVRRGDFRFAGALVDLHLTDRMADFEGKAVIDYLREHHPHIRIMLMSAGLPGGDIGTMPQEYGVRRVFLKDEAGALELYLRPAVRRLLDDP